MLVEDRLDARVEHVAVRQQLVELHLAEDRAERRLRELRRLVAVVEHLDHGAPRLDDAKEDDRVDLQRDVVARDDVLRRHLERLLSQRDAHHPVDGGEDQEDARTFCVRQQPSQSEDHAAFVLGQDLDRAEEVDDEDEKDDEDERIEHVRLRARADGAILRQSAGSTTR